ncbi:MAG: TonB-dependent receptor plug domain-containing protein, partial [Muribaculaceae bacterium]|nr:TonB-dependent receptor plug domain-containing protein [Muribaculaceae bacterium]
MKRIIVSMMLMCAAVLACHAQRVTINAVDMPAADVFRTIMTQTGRNFIYPSDLLTDVKVSVTADGVPMKQVLDEMFRGLDIEYKVKGRNVVLKRRAGKRRRVEHVRAVRPSGTSVGATLDTVAVLDEVVVSSRLEAPGVTTAEIGAKKITADEVRRVPALLGENDVIKTLHMQPGVVAGADGMAAMYVHGGNADENLCMLDNVPMYQVNHFAGLFSSFNPDVIRYIDFFKTSVPAKYDGRLSSFMDVRLQNVPVSYTNIRAHETSQESVCRSE